MYKFHLSVSSTNWITPLVYTILGQPSYMLRETQSETRTYVVDTHNTACGGTAPADLFHGDSVGEVVQPCSPLLAGDVHRHQTKLPHLLYLQEQSINLYQHSSPVELWCVKSNFPLSKWSEALSTCKIQCRWWSSTVQ